MQIALNRISSALLVANEQISGDWLVSSDPHALMMTFAARYSDSAARLNCGIYSDSAQKNDFAHLVLSAYGVVAQSLHSLVTKDSSLQHTLKTATDPDPSIERARCQTLIERLSNRQLEAELMIDAANVLAYAEADFSASHQRIVDFLNQKIGTAQAGIHVVDLGCGPGDVSRRLLRSQPNIMLEGIDGSEGMIATARAMSSAYDGRVVYRVAQLQNLPTLLAPADIILATGMLHHLPNPLELWNCIRTMHKGAHGAEILVADLIRPESASEAARLVQVHAGQERAELQRDFYHSFLASFRISEVQAQLRLAGLEHLIVEKLDDLHLVVHGDTH